MTYSTGRRTVPKGFRCIDIDNLFLSVDFLQICLSCYREKPSQAYEFAITCS